MRNLQVIALRCGVGSADVGHDLSPVPISCITIEAEGMWVNAPPDERGDVVPESVYLQLAVGSDQIADLIPVLLQFTNEIATPFAQLAAAKMTPPTDTPEGE